MIQTDVERYADLTSFAREVNLPLLGTSGVDPVPSGANLSAMLRVLAPPELGAVVDGLAETRQSLTLRSLLVAGFADDPECFATGLAIAREWSRRGLKVAVIDLDFWNPTVVRPRPHPNEGLLDVLEYGCSFRRVAWEIVADGLWLIGPGSHPPDADRVADHPDWERAARGLSAHVDVTFYVAPLLDRKGLVGRLSKRMDGVLLAASSKRIGRGELKDAFLELWGSDAPIIGCVGIEASAARSGAAGAAQAGRVAEAAPEAHAPVEARPAASPKATDSPARRHADKPRAAKTPGAGTGTDEELTAVLDREVRSGARSYRQPRGRSRGGLVAGIAVGVLVAASVAVVLLRRPEIPPSGETMPAGTEEILPAAPDAVPQSTGDAEPVAPVGGGETEPAPPILAAPESPDASEPDMRGIVPSAPTPDTPFRVHVASFKSEEKVQQMVRDLRLRGADAWYESAANATGYHRVFVGHFATEAEARAHAQWLLDNGWVDRAQAYPTTTR